MMRPARSVTLFTLAAICLVSPATAGDDPAGADLLDRIKAGAAATSAELIEIRRTIHMNPEISGQEVETAKLIAERLRGLGLEVTTGIGGHGVSGLLRGGKPGPVVAYRADMDAVPSPVVGDPPYKSRVEGVKHVCGHDAHVAVGLGVAGVLASVREELPGTVKFIFQPAEENVQGARAMIADGVLENPAPQAIFGVHTGPWPAGTIVCPAGVGLTGWLPFAVELAAEEGVDVVAQEVAEAIGAMSTVEPPWSPEAFTAFIDGLLVENGPYERFVFVGMNGVQPGDDGSSMVIQGMIRADGPESYQAARGQLQAAVKKAAEGRARFEVQFDGERFPDMHSDADLVRAAVGPIEAAIGKGKAVPMHASAPFFGEDFALFQEHIPGAMFFLGVANREKGITAFNHFPDYDIDESAIEIGTVAMANVLLDYLRSH